MKKIILTSLLVLLFAFTFQAQAHVNVSVNISAQPVWGPVGYSHVEYYYLPQYEVYYSVPKAQWVYLDGGNWVFASALPSRFGTINYYNTYKVVVNQPTPYLQFKTHKVKYAKYKGGSYKQVIIRDSKEPKYYVVKGHPNYGAPGQVKKSAPVKSSATPSRSSAPRPSSSSAKPAKASPSPQAHKNNGGGNPHSGGHGGGNGKGGGNKGGGHGGGKH